MTENPRDVPEDNKGRVEGGGYNSSVPAEIAYIVVQRAPG